MKNDMIKDLYEKAKNLSESPGVYKFLDEKGSIIYVGKAKRLRRRVVSYFQPGRAHDARIERMISDIRHIETIQVTSEAEALIFEAGLIKDHTPKYNIDLKDDKSYPFLKLTVNEGYPRLFVTRRKVADGAEYYGPYADAGLLKEAVIFMKKVFPLRTCRKMGKKLCLEAHIGQCLGPCANKGIKNEYAKTVARLKAFLEGKKDVLMELLQKDMKKFSSARDYEKAMLCKSRIEALSTLQKFHDGGKYPLFGELEELKAVLGLAVLPNVIECFDISNISGTNPVGSMVSFIGGKANKAGYRKFKIRNVQGIDDYSMIREVVKRRYSRILAESGKLPNLVIIDGGKGHLSAAKKELDDLGLGTLPIISIAKEFNHIYTTGSDRPLRLSPGARLLLLIQRVRDEAHRFAITFHRKLRSKSFLE
ncbi:MAG TPA: excinuclease ABC subunit UvrC [Candidatus Omnitrophota bacterium]|nr:excinuclease ABC subunit UvrC [Candidatus Omnitrophota bacterium]